MLSEGLKLNDPFGIIVLGLGMFLNSSRSTLVAVTLKADYIVVGWGKALSFDCIFIDEKNERTKACAFF